MRWSLFDDLYICRYFCWVFIFRLRGCFSFSTLNILHHCLLTYTVSNEKSAAVLIFVFLYIMCPFALAKRFSLFISIEQLDQMCVGVFLFRCLMLRAYWVSWICEFIVSIKFRKTLVILQTVFLFSCLFCADSNFMCIRLLEVVQ